MVHNMGKRKGSKKESIVANKLKKRGYIIEERNVIKKLNQHKKAEYDIIAKYRNCKYAIEVKSGKQILCTSVIENHIKKANKIKAKPMFVIGKNVKLTEKALKLAKKHKVRIIVM
ncbi:NERD domain-containing protein [Methanocaldococcus indicus]|uniref:NERD domain-containing protein n=1 Tax=Methanocaldococcus indicus TaxID=213231 RepID=UPI003C6CEB63